MRPQGNFFFLESRTTNLLWLGLLGLVVIFFFMLVFEAVAIESDLGKQVSHQLSQSGFKRIEVSVNGRDVSLVGAVSSLEARQRVINIARKVEGVRAVKADASIAPLRLSHIRLRRDQSGWQELSGELASIEALESLKQQLGFVGSADENAVFFVIHDVEVTESPWLGMVEQVVEASIDIQNLVLEIGAHHIVVGGSVSTAVDYAGAFALIQSLANQYDLTLVNRLATINRLQ